MEPKPLHEIGKVKLGCECFIYYNNKLLVFKRSEESKRFPGYIVGPGGHIDEGEDPLSAAIREVKEETGLTVTSSEIKLKGIGIHHLVDKGEFFTLFMYLVRPSADQKLVHSHEGKSTWVTLEELSKTQKVLPSFYYYVDHVVNNKPGIMYVHLSMTDDAKLKIYKSEVDSDY